MNQFKKAKQLKNETGQTVESITDLKTAGVSEKSQNSENSLVDTIPIDHTSINSVKMLDSQTELIATPTQPLQNNTSVIPSSTMSLNIRSIEQLIDSPKSSSGFMTLSQDNIVADTIPSKSSEIIKSTSANTFNISEQETNDTLVNEVLSPSYPKKMENKTNSSTIIVQSHNVSQQFQETTNIKHSKSSKKSVPNIFSPKGEAKSTRKSLVLKPTSVKIAEDYCVKNGGSFNELIQTLLDNFIDEYGL